MEHQRELNARHCEVAAPRACGYSATPMSDPVSREEFVAYAIDHDRTISYLPKHRFSQWKISMSQLHETAITNLSASSEAIEARAAQDESGQVNLILFQTMDGYDASRLLLPTLHERLRE